VIISQRKEKKIMIRRGQEPYLECSSKGDKRFSAFYAKVHGKSIEKLYQAAKIFEDGSTGLTWRKAKGRKPINIEELVILYKDLWREYLLDNPSFITILQRAVRLSDIFGQEGHQCQATTLWELRSELSNKRVDIKAILNDPEKKKELIDKVVETSRFFK